MRNLKDNSWNADADVIWNSLETIDYPIVTLTNGTEFTDVDIEKGAIQWLFFHLVRCFLTN